MSYPIPSPGDIKAIRDLIKCPYIELEDYDVSGDVLTLDLSNSGHQVIDLAARVDLSFNGRRVDAHRLELTGVGSQIRAPTIPRGGRRTFQADTSFRERLSSRLGVDLAISDVETELREKYRIASTKIHSSVPSDTAREDQHEYIWGAEATRIAEDTIDMGWIKGHKSNFPDIREDVSITVDIYISFKTTRYLPWEKRLLRTSAESASIRESVARELEKSIRSELNGEPRWSDQTYDVDAGVRGHAGTVSPNLAPQTRAFCDIFLTRRDRSKLKRPLRLESVGQSSLQRAVTRSRPIPYSRGRRAIGRR